MKKIKAAVDIGSNTVQMLAGFEEQGQIVPVYRYLATTRLGAQPSLPTAAEVEAFLRARE